MSEAHKGSVEGYVVEVRQARGEEVLVWDPQPNAHYFMHMP